jgi:tryptophanyl-tRNA synthetase
MKTGNITKPRLLSGDTPTGKLHLGHWVGNIERRIALQDEYDCYFLLANVHAFSTRARHPDEIRRNTLDIATDYLAAGIDPQKITLFIQSEVPAIAELTCLLSMILPFPRLMRNPTIKDEIRDKGLGDNYPFGFLLYPVGQVADILSFRPAVVPVGEDQLPHLEMARELARRFNQIYCDVDSHTLDKDHIKAGGLFPVFEPLVGRVKRLVGLGAPTADGRLLKMSKSLGNAILLSDDPDTIKKKVMGMYTDPSRLRVTDPGHVDNNPLWIFHEAFNPDKAWVADAEARYRAGTIGDVDCKKKLIEVLVELIEPMRQRRLSLEKDESFVWQVLKEGTMRANEVTEDTLWIAKEPMKQDYFKRTLKFL